MHSRPEFPLAVLQLPLPLDSIFDLFRFGNFVHQKCFHQPLQAFRQLLRVCCNKSYEFDNKSEGLVSWFLFNIFTFKTNDGLQEKQNKYISGQIQQR